MENKIAELNQGIKSLNKIKINEIVGIVVSLLDNSKSLAKSFNAENKNISLMHSDICDFISENEKQMESHSQ